MLEKLKMLDAALGWADRGFEVFPLKPRSKVPLGTIVTRGFLDASKDLGVIHDWWRTEPRANIGVRTGGGRFVVDLDDAGAVSWFVNACGRHGGAPRTLTTRTSRGFHVFFSADAGVPCSTGRLAPGADVRGDGGYVVAAPSIHPSGVVYRIERDLPVARAPEWLVDEVVVHERPVPARVQFNSDACKHDSKLRGVAGILALVANAREGERNAMFYWGTCRLAEKVSA
ncbi:MAG: bifunctional DNA primase/polymerase, partial [Pseudomonadota bacterium]|nr:bifunctional DNA primase/polymerase [Pseudomonadota bacterium]